MNKSSNSAASTLLALSLTGVLLAVGQAQDRGQSPRPGPPLASVQARPLGGRAGVRQRMSAEEKLIRNAYVKLMRYQSAGVDELAATSSKESGPDDYIRFELRDIHTGSIEEISSRPLDDIVTPRGGDTVILKGHHLTWGSGPAHAYYEATWRTETNREQPQERTERQTASQVTSGKDLFVGVERYTTYQVTVMLGGKQRVYRAMAMHLGNRETGVEKSEIVDNITSDMNHLLAEESPRVRSPCSGADIFDFQPGSFQEPFCFRHSVLPQVLPGRYTGLNLKQCAKRDGERHTDSAISTSERLRRGLSAIESMTSCIRTSMLRLPFLLMVECEGENYPRKA